MIKIQKLTQKDVVQVAKLLKDEWLLHANNTRVYSKQKIEARDTTEWLQSRVIESGDFGCVVAYNSGEPVGMLLYRIIDNTKIAVNDKSLKVEDIYVLEEARGKGVARELLAWIENTAHSQGVREVTADVHSFNDASKNLFRNSGYQPEYTNYLKLLGSEESKELLKEDIASSDRAKLYADGGSRGNPGPSAGGYVILNMDNNVVKSNGKFLGITTNNQAEYHSLKGGIEMAIDLGVRDLDIYMDSLLVINQMKGIFKIKNRDLWPIHDAIKQLLPKFQRVTFTHVPRELNKLADKVVNDTLDQHTK